jgi:D-aminopeptidase
MNQKLLGIAGILVILAIAFALSTNRKAIRPRVVGAAFALQAAIAFLVIYTSWGRAGIQTLSNGVSNLLGYATKGTEFLFGPSDANPLAHTMNTRLYQFLINGEPASELYINSLIASYFGVPVFCVAGDRGLCDWMKTKNINTVTVPVVEGFGGGTVSPHPAAAVKMIYGAVNAALQMPSEAFLFPMPESVEMRVSFREHQTARKGGFYPGAKQLDERTVSYESRNFMDVLKFMMFVVNS